MCGKALPYRTLSSSSLSRLWLAIGGAASKKIKALGKSETFRTSGGRAAAFGHGTFTSHTSRFTICSTMSEPDFDKKAVVGLLNEILETELAGVVRYTHYSLMVFG